MTRAALYEKTGGPDVLFVAEVPERHPDVGEVLVRVRAAGLNPMDTKLRSGAIPSGPPFPRRVGADVAGTVEAVGEGVFYFDGTPVRVGDEIAGRAPGAVAERVIAAASEISRRPGTVPPEVAGGLWIAGLTAISCLATIPFGPEDSVLVGGAAGAVGLIVSQLAIQRGVRVIGTASRQNHPLLRSLGVEPVEYGDGLAARVSEQSAPTAVIDTHGRDALDAGVALGIPADRMVAIAAYDAIDELGVHSVERAARTSKNLAGLLEQLADGRLVLPIAAAFALADVVPAFEALETSHAPGKIVVVA